MLFLGVDIGGVNVKVSSLNLNNGFELKSVKVHYPIWIRGIEELPKTVKHAMNLLGCNNVDYVAMTMTAELSDVFNDKREGVEKVIRTLNSKFENFKVIANDGTLLDPSEAIDNYMKVAAANWWCVGWFASQLEENCVVVDVGSTTTTITPVIKRRVAAKGLNDVEKMCLGEIVYVGSLRTPVSSIVSMVPVNGVWCRVSSEYFANTGDVNLLLGFLKDHEYDAATPDGRGKSLDECHHRLSRVVCGDGRMLRTSQTKLIANFVYEKMVEKVFEGLSQVLSRVYYEDNCLDVGLAAGLGDFIALDAIRKARLRGVLLRNIIGRENSIALTSASLAIYLAYTMGVDVKVWFSSLR